MICAVYQQCITGPVPTALVIDRPSECNDYTHIKPDQQLLIDAGVQFSLNPGCRVVVISAPPVLGKCDIKR